MLDQVKQSIISHGSPRRRQGAPACQHLPRVQRGGRVSAGHREKPGYHYGFQRLARRPPGGSGSVVSAACRPLSGVPGAGGRAADQAVICARELKPSLSIMCCTWLSTVRTEMTSSLAILLFDIPRATSTVTSCSRRVSCPGPAPACVLSPRAVGRDASPSANAMASAWLIAVPLASA